MNYDTIKNQCEEIMAANFNQISHQTDFFNLELDDMQLYVSDICRDTVSNDAAADAALRWTSHEEGRITGLEDLLHKVQLNKCSDEGIKTLIKTHGSLLDKTPMIYKLLVNTLADIETDAVVVIGGREGDNVHSNTVCWKIDKSNEVSHMSDIPAADLGASISLCVIPQGFVITGGAGPPLCMMFIASTKLWVRLQDLLEQRHGHGSICVENVLYILRGFMGKPIKGLECSDSVHSMELKCGKWNDGPSLPLAVKFPKVTNTGSILCTYLMPKTLRSCGMWMLIRECGRSWRYFQCRRDAME